MQWLIDIILDLVQPMLDALKVTIHGQLGFFDRGDPAPVDWTQAALTADFLWHVLDCSAIVPANAKTILLNIAIRDNLVGMRLHLREYGNVNVANICEMRTQVGNLYVMKDKICACDSERRVEYRLSATVWSNITITIRGWWLR